MTIIESSLLTKNYEQASETISKAFQPNKFNYYATLGQSIEENKKDFASRLKQLVEDANTHIAQADDFAAVSVWIPPEFDTPAYPEPINERFRFAEEEFSRCSKRYLKGKPHWHLTVLAKDPNRQNIKGSISKVVKPFLDKAKEQNVPAVLEAIDERAKDIYLHYGFKIYEVIKIGVGEINEMGDPDLKGSGYNVYYMIYNLE